MPMQIFPLSVKLNFNGLMLFLVRPFMLSFYIWVIILLFVPNYFKKHTAEIINTKLRNSFEKNYSFDLNGDNISERISAGYNDNDNVVGIKCLNQNAEAYDQWRFPGKWLRSFKLTFGDYNKNGFSEVYFLTLVGDSIFLHAKELMIDNGLEIRDRFVCKVGTFDNNQQDVVDWGGKLMDIDSDGFDDYIFFLHAGYSKFPRNTFAYNIVTDSLSISPLSASGFFRRTSFMDINGDGVDEITGMVGAPENIHYPIPYTDSCAWLMVINPKTMHFSFSPIRFDVGISSYINPVFCEIDDGKYIATVVVFNSARMSKGIIELVLHDAEGKCIKTKEVDKRICKSLTFINSTIKSDKGVFLFDNYGNIYRTDTSLNLKQHFVSEAPINWVAQYKYGCIDANGDGKDEMIFFGGNNNDVNLLIYTPDLKSCTILPLPEIDFVKESHLGIIEGGNEDNHLLMLQVNNSVYTIKYLESDFYFFKYPVYIAIYLLLFLFFTLLQRVQNNLAQRKFATERQLIMQQLTISKRQLEPHFMLNTLNSIGYMFSKENKDDAQYYFGKFASLIHRGLKYADQVETTLNEELEFVKDYLILQKRRFNGNLDFSIEFDAEIESAEIKIPHSLIFTFVENAVKHGLMHKMSDRKISIQVVGISKQIQIIITDNGIGRKQSRVLNTRGTGKGLGIVANIIEGYNKLNNRSVSYTVKDLIGDNGEGVGTEVRVEL